MDLGLVWYNKDLFDAANLAYPSNDWTWDDYRATAKALASGEGPGKIWGSEMPQLQHFLWQAGADYFSADGLSCALNTPEAKEAYNFILGMMDEGICPRERLYEGGFNAGRAGMTLGSGPWYAFYMLNDAEFTWDVAAMPQHKHKATTAYGSSFGILKSSENIDAAFEFISWFLSDEQQFIRAKQFSWFPPSGTVLDFPGFDGEDVLNMNTVQKQLVMDETEYGRAPLVVANQNEINQIITRENSLIWAGEKSVDDGLAAMEAEINPLLQP
jgi:multiple sugar transport system substrate-binding protein